MSRKTLNRFIFLVAAAAVLVFLGGCDADEKQKKDCWGLLFFLFFFGPVLDFLGGYSIHIITTGLMPGLHRRHRETLGRSPWKSFFLGLVNFLFVLFLAAAAFNNEAPILGIFLLIVLLLMLALGLQAPAANLGSRVYRDDPAKSDIARARTGWFAWCFVQYLPVIGIIASFIAAITGLGAFIISIATRDSGTRYEENNEALQVNAGSEASSARLPAQVEEKKE
jgi:MFS family permease